MEWITELTGKQMVEQYGNRRIIDTWTQVIKWSSDQVIKHNFELKIPEIANCQVQFWFDGE